MTDDFRVTIDDIVKQVDGEPIVSTLARLAEMKDRRGGAREEGDYAREAELSRQIDSLSAVTIDMLLEAWEDAIEIAADAEDKAMGDEDFD